MSDHAFQGDSDLYKFLQSFAGHDLLDARRERRLITLAQKEGKRARAAMHELAEKNLRLMLMMASRYRPAGIKFGFALSDLFGEAYIGFRKAVEEYDLDHPKKVRLSTYAVWWMRSAIQRAIHDKGRTIRVPVHVSEAWQKIDRAIRAFANDAGAEPSDAELAAMLGEPEKRISAVRQAMRLEPASFDEPTADDPSLKLIDIVQDPSKQGQDVVAKLEADDDLRLARKSLDALTDLERAIVSCRVEEGMTLKETAVAIRHLTRKGRLLSRERVRQLQTKAVGKLRRAFHKAG